MRYAILSLGVLFSAGCATLFSSKAPVAIPSSVEPDGATVYVDGQRVGTTPYNLVVERKKSHIIAFQKEGYKDASCQLTATAGAGWIILDVLGGLIPVVIDAATGDWMKVGGTCNVQMEPLPPAATASSSSN